MGMLKLVLLAIALLALAVAGLAIRIWGKKDGQFPGTCAGNSPFLSKEGESCSICGAAPNQQCRNKEDRL